MSYTESVWTEGVLGQTAELRGEVLSWSQVGWQSFAHFARVWAIVLVLGCDGIMAHLAPVVSGPYMPLLFHLLCKSEALLHFECRW